DRLVRGSTRCRLSASASARKRRGNAGADPGVAVSREVAVTLVWPRGNVRFRCHTSRHRHTVHTEHGKATLCMARTPCKAHTYQEDMVKGQATPPRSANGRRC